MNPAEYRIRCRMAESCLPDAEYRARLTALHDDMLTEIEALREALAEERRVRLLGQEPDVHWESLRDIRRACYAKTDAALARTGEKT